VTVLRVTEAAWQTQVIDLAQLLGWRVAHFRAAQTDRGWRTPVQADGAGYPDLVLVRGSELLFVELKAQRGRLSGEQRAWLDALRAVADAVTFAVGVAHTEDERMVTAGVALPDSVRVDRRTAVEVHVWRPADFDAVHTRLRRPAPAPSEATS
jgi:hypothetical protein